MQFDQQTKDTPDYLFFIIRGRASTSTNPEGYLVFYGIKGWTDFVAPQIYDKPWNLQCLNMMEER